MTINELITNFTEHLKKYGLNGDPYQQELYKWEIISKYHDGLDAVAGQLDGEPLAGGGLAARRRSGDEHHPHILTA